MATNTKIKTLLFGAGEGCSRFIENELAKREFLAIIDNNEKRSGEIFHGVKIIAPKELERFKFDEIVITTQWVKEVQKQLIEDLGVEPDKVVVPSKKSLKKPQPFRDEKTRALAAEVLKTIAQKAYEDDVELFVDTGTLLGIVRDGGIMPWDDDIDFAFNISNGENASFDIKSWISDAINSANLPANFKISALINKEGVVVDVAIDCKAKGHNPFRASVNVRQDVGENSIELASLGLYYAPAKYFKYYEILEWEGVKLKVPNHYREYLSFVYGDWEVVKENISFTDYNHLGEVNFEDFKDAGLHQI